MAAKPTQEDIWNDDDLNDTAPNGAKIALGWEVNEAPSSSTFNWLQKYLFKAVAYLLEGVFVGDAGAPGLDVTGGTGNTNGVVGHGIGTGTGVQGFAPGAGTGVHGGSVDGPGGVFYGGNTGEGVVGIGPGASYTPSGNGDGVTGVGGAFGSGGHFTAGASGTGVICIGRPSGSGFSMTVLPNAAATNATALLAEGKGTGAGLHATAVGATVPAIVCDGSINLAGASDVSSSTAVANKLTKALLPKAWGNVSTNSDTVNDGVNVTSAVAATSSPYAVTVTLATAMANANYCPVVTAERVGSDFPATTVVQIINSSTFKILVCDQTEAAIDLSTENVILHFVVFGKQ